MNRPVSLAKRVLIAVGVIAVVSGLAWGVFWWQVLGPRKELRGLLETMGDDVPDAVLRGVCHRCIRWTGDHDSFIYLQEVGDESSLPCLMRALGRMEDVQMCTKLHCVDALEAISGENFGEDVDAWERWYDQR